MKISICIITYKRPESLVRLLRTFQQFTFIKCERPIIELIVIDNDVIGNAANLCKTISLELNMEVKCFTEIQRGISYARNKAVESVSYDADFIAFIDDDEIAEPAWLDELLFTQERHNADVVTGCVLPYFINNVPRWIQKGAFFERERYPTGQVLDWARTGNVLIRRKIFDQIGKFDERFALTGGEDTHFFMRVHRAGYKIVWSNEAVVYEWIPATRITTRWILQRAFRNGNSFILCNKDLSPLIVTLFWTARGFWRIFKGVLGIPFVLFFGRHRIVKSLQSAFNGAGIIAGMMNINYKEYRRTHGN
jgi:glycosyltransferase involved in cell wall biosynthesis